MAGCAHLWNSTIGVPSKIVESDWCCSCGAPRPGYMDPRTKWIDDDPTEQGTSDD